MDLEAKAVFIRKILCFEAFKILFSQFDRMLENKSLHEREGPLVLGECASDAYFGLTSQEWSLTC